MRDPHGCILVLTHLCFRALPHIAKKKNRDGLGPVPAGA
jgi:hypothetical protein